MEIFWTKVLNDEPFNISEITYHLEGKGVSTLKNIARGHFSKLVRLDMDIWKDMAKLLDFNCVFLNPTFTERMYREFEYEILGNGTWSKKFCLYCPFAPYLKNEIPKKLHKILELNGKKESKLSYENFLIKAEVDSIGIELPLESYIQRSMFCQNNQVDMNEIFSKTVDIADFDEYRKTLNSKNKKESFEKMMDSWNLLSQNPMFETYQDNYIDMTGFCGNPNIDEKFIKKYKKDDGFDRVLFSSNLWLKGKNIKKYDDLISKKGFVYNHYAPYETFTSKNYLNSYDITNLEWEVVKNEKSIYPTCNVYNPAVPFSFFF